jgi:hypothetical protein
VTSALGDDVVGTTGLRVSRILTREIDTRVVMRDGQTIVLGGLLSDRKTRTINKIPGLGDLPVLNLLFRQENPTSERVDLLVFLTAHIQGAARINERDQRVFDMYRPQFKQIDRLQDVPLHFEIPTEYETPKPMFGDPPATEFDDDCDEHTAGKTTPKHKPAEKAPDVRSTAQGEGRSADDAASAAEESKAVSAAQLEDDP